MIVFIFFICLALKLNLNEIRDTIAFPAKLIDLKSIISAAKCDLKPLR